MGEVYRARDPRLSREVAIKVLPSSFSQDSDRLRRFEQEAKAASALNHPNIVTIHDMGTQDGSPYVVSELLEGETLRDRLAGGALSPRKALDHAREIARGLGAAHEKRIVHRDLKPENIFVTRDGRVKILDFGLAKLTQAGTGSGEESNLPTQTATTPGVVMGTVGYMSPEQASGRIVDFRSDQFSFGSVLYEMATGKRAFHRGTAVQTLSAIIAEEPDAVGSINPQVPVPLRWIVERCLAKDAEERYASTRDLARELATVRDRLSEATLSGAVVVTPPSRVSSRLRAAVLALALLAAVLAGIFAGQPIWKARFGTQPTLRQITFRRAGITDARFTPDGQIVYGVGSGSQEKGNPGELFSTRPGAVEPRSLGLPPANVLSVSSSGELAILVGGFPRLGTLATVPFAGGAPRELLEDVRLACWSPDGKALVAVHIVKGKMRLEFPIGTVLYEASGWIGKIRFSPKGDLIAFDDHSTYSPGGSGVGELTVMDLSGKRRTIGPSQNELAWSPRGDEIWTNNYTGNTSTIEAVNLSGRRRRVASFAGNFGLQDVSRDGQVLLEGVVQEREMVGRLSGEPAERNLSWLDGSVPADLSADGKALLFTELRQGGGPNHAVYKRKTDGSPAVRLGEGTALALSPDGAWALSSPGGSASHLVLLPMGPGEQRTVPLSGLRIQGGGTTFFPDGKRILLRGSEAGPNKVRIYVLDLESGKARPITPEGVSVLSRIALSPDGRTVVSSDDDGESHLFDVEGGPPRSVPGFSAGLFAIKWCADGRSLFVRTTGEKPLKVYRLELSSGRLDLWKEFSVPDIGTGQIEVIPTPDGKSYVYTYLRYFSDLYLAEGLK